MEIEQELQSVAESYRNQGYAVTVRPLPDQLPAFARDFRIEILATRGVEGVLVAVRKTRDELAADGDMQRYAETTSSEQGWRFDFAILEAENPDAREVKSATEFSQEDITQSLNQAEQLSRTDFSRYAVVAAWAAVEAAMRMRLRVTGQSAGWGTAPSQMVKELYSAGILSPDEFKEMDSVSQLRNRIVHGFSGTSTEDQPSDVDAVHLLNGITRRLVTESQSAKQYA